MPGLTISQAATANELAASLADLVTNRLIDEVCQAARLPSQGTNKIKRLQCMLAAGLEDGRRRPTLESAVATLVMAAHGRHVAGRVTLTQDDVDEIVGRMKRLGLSTGGLGGKRWRAKLPKRAPAESKGSTCGPHAVVPPPAGTDPARAFVPRSHRHDAAVGHVGELQQPETNPQYRGRQLELILLEVLKHERLSPARNIVIPGEQIDLSFVLDAQHYLVECKWTKERVGLPEVHLFASKVSSKAEGTFGVLLSMSGFVRRINESATRGRRLNTVGVTGVQLMRVLEGHQTWSDLVRKARKTASTRALFLSQ